MKRDRPRHYPASISLDRYTGAYSGGLWIVQIGHEYVEPWLGDTECHEFWDKVMAGEIPGIFPFHTFEEAVAFFKKEVLE